MFGRNSGNIVKSLGMLSTWNITFNKSRGMFCFVSIISLRRCASKALMLLDGQHLFNFKISKANFEVIFIFLLELHLTHSTMFCQIIQSHRLYWRANLLFSKRPANRGCTALLYSPFDEQPPTNEEFAVGAGDGVYFALLYKHNYGCIWINYRSR